MLTLLVPNLIMVFGAPQPTGSLVLESTDEDRVWRAAWNPERLNPSKCKTDARLIGTTSDLFLALWRRPHAAKVLGDVSSLASWNATISGT